jgi:hypothetical protein
VVDGRMINAGYKRVVKQTFGILKKGISVKELHKKVSVTGLHGGPDPGINTTPGGNL